MIRWSAILAVALAVAALAAGCGGDDEDDPNVAWADGVCTSITAWIDSVESAADSLQESGTLEERAGAALEDVRTATDALDGDLEDLGAPEVGEEAVASLDELVDELRSGIESIEQAVENGEGLEALSTIGATVAAMSEAVSAAVDELEQLDGGETLRDAFDEADSCVELRDAAS